MYEEFCIKQRKRADEHLAEFLAANPAYSLDQERPDWLKGTHLVAFGAYRKQAVVFKYYDGDPRKEHEKRALELFGPTGLVPRVLGETDVMLVMERVPGSTMHEMGKSLSQPAWHKLHSGLGRAVATIVDAAPGADTVTQRGASFRASDQREFYNTPYDALMELYRQADTATFFDTTLARSARVLCDRDVPHVVLCAE